VGALHPDYISYRVKRLHLLMSQWLDDALKPHGLGRSQWQVLFRVRRAGTLGQKELSQALQIEPATLTGIVDVLVAKGWLDRAGSCDDKRCRVLTLTEAGAALMDSIADPYAIVEKRMRRGIAAADVAQAESTLEALIRNLEERD
jgi:DNA-binding MarR family transcriptional regulator